MGSDQLSKFLKQHAAPPPLAPTDELAQILARTGSPVETPKWSRAWAGGGVALFSFMIAFTLIRSNPTIPSAATSATGPVMIAATPIPTEALDASVSEFFEETTGAYDTGFEDWADEEFLL